MNTYKKIAVLGGGSFGTVLANLAASNGHNVSLWVRDSDQALRINSEGANTIYHPELKLSENILATDSLEEVLKDASATAIYGNRGANGVVLITTKSVTVPFCSLLLSNMVTPGMGWPS